MWPILLLPFLSTVAASYEDDNSSTTRCQDGLLLPAWQPQDNLTTGDRVARGLVYFISLIYLFLGVSIISDRFMSAIEVITSQEKEVTVKKKGVATQKVVVRVWNETVANLTLMALGSSAPEILLSIIEIYAKDFNAGDLGPGTIVGSAAYNLFVIIALCISVIPAGEVRKIKHLRVFFVTATWSVFAYIWMYAILAVFSPGEVEVWEGIITFMFFPATVLTAYIADRRIALHKLPYKKFRLNRNRVIVAAESADIDMDKEPDVELLEDGLEQTRRDYTIILRDLKKQNPKKSISELEVMAREQIENTGPKSRAFYRIQATRSMTGGSLTTKPRETSGTERHASGSIDDTVKISFNPDIYSVLENVGSFEVTVVREGRDLSQEIIVAYKTEDGTATAGTDYVGASGTIVFNPGDTARTIKLQVIDDEIFEDEEYFFVHLTDVRCSGGSHTTKLVNPKTAKVLILDDDHCGVFGFPEPSIDVPESEGVYELPVERSSGARGKIRVPYHTEDGTAKAGKDYQEAKGVIVFENNESSDVRESSEDIRGQGFSVLSLVMTSEVVGLTQPGRAHSSIAAPVNSAPIRKRWSHLFWPKLKIHPTGSQSSPPPPPPPPQPTTTPPPPPPPSSPSSPSSAVEEEPPETSTAPFFASSSGHHLSVSQEDWNDLDEILDQPSVGELSSTLNFTVEELSLIEEMLH